ncbi:hypothetical protein [uncultured Winogradskyella sp.]|uniref:hypothetical protein n=1 Tax=uncultured Winogradskyella sp. TaxID=395353 RepID=UPI0026132747|nr:hypothetical protein [uncultured Winogradskyella sp.]
MDLYKNIGKLFYAISASDKVIKTIEFKALKKSLDTQWRNDYTKAQINAIIDSFLFLKDCYASPNICFNEFSKYKEEHEWLFTTKLKNLIFNTSCSIASSFASKNKSELILLAKLGLLFKK